MDKAYSENAMDDKRALPTEGNYFALRGGHGSLLYINTLADDPQYDVEYGILDGDGNVVMSDLLLAGHFRVCDVINDIREKEDIPEIDGYILGCHMGGWECWQFDRDDIREINEEILVLKHEREQDEMERE